MITSRINRSIFENKHYEIILIDVNSLFLFTSDPAKKLYEFINKLKHCLLNDNVLIINVIDNGKNRKMVRRFPDYKANRITSKENNNPTVVNVFNKRNKFKRAIDRILHIDNKVKNHLTFYLTGESDFKIGYILQ